MDYRKLMVVVGSPEASGPAVDAALTVARKFDSHVEAMHVRADPRQAIPYMGEGMSGAMVEDMDVTSVRKTLYASLRHALQLRERVWGRQELRRWEHASLDDLAPEMYDGLIRYLGDEERVHA